MGDDDIEDLPTDEMLLRDLEELEGIRLTRWDIVKLIVFGLLTAVIVWTLLGVWRYLQVASNGTF